MKAREVVKAYLRCLDNEAWNFEFPFNPEKDSMKLSRDVHWSADRTGYDPWGGPLDYENGEPDQLEFSVLLDETALGEIDLADATAFEAALLSAISSLLGDDRNDASVLPQLEELWRLTVPVKPQGSAEGSFNVRPPVVAFIWEAFVFVGGISGLDVDFLVMDEEGKARRAKVDIKMKGRAFAGSTSLAEFLDAVYTPPRATSASDTSDKKRHNLLESLR